jgi:HAD superfamily hydrolase (TIGR01509 family)
VIKHLILDVDGVLMPFEDATAAVTHAVEKFHITDSKRRELVGKYGPALDIGAASFHDLINELNMYEIRQNKDFRAIDPDEYLAAIYEKLTFNDELIAFAQEQRQNGIRVSIFSNNYKENVNYLRRYLNLNDWTHRQIWSCFFGMKKPDPKFYRLLLRELHAKSEECLFVDDQEKNVHAGREQACS